MQLTWLGHSGFRLEIGKETLLIDPWLKGNPSFPPDKWNEAVHGTTAILASHGHGDHASNTTAISKELGVPVLCMVELAKILGAEGANTIGFNKGGTVKVGEICVSMVTATHSSSVDFTDNGLQYAGGEAGFIIRGEGHTIYFSGDTDVSMEMDVIADRYKPDIGILCAGGHYTMDMEGAAYATRRFFDFQTVIPCHYNTFPILEQDPEVLKRGVPVGVSVIVPEVMVPVRL